MNCHECARAESDRQAIVICRHCSVGLCKEHLVEMHRSSSTPLYTGLHQPERVFDRLGAR